jgi:tRNA (guanine37-N1)-methyltransferase
MNVTFITLFPEMIAPVLNNSILLRAQKQGLFSYEIINLRDFGIGPRHQVDDTPYGGGDGMLLRPEPIISAIEVAKSEHQDALVILPTPRGKPYKQSVAKQLVQRQQLIIVCPRYEGYDERIVHWVDKSYCIGSYILTGGELPALVIVDSVVRLIPGVLGNKNSINVESFQDDNQQIEFPQYTRPASYRDLKVPEVLLNGNHQLINDWRQANKH